MIFSWVLCSNTAWRVNGRQDESRLCMMFPGVTRSWSKCVGAALTLFTCLDKRFFLRRLGGGMPIITGSY